MRSKETGLPNLDQQMLIIYFYRIRKRDRYFTAAESGVTRNTIEEEHYSSPQARRKETYPCASGEKAAELPHEKPSVPEAEHFDHREVQTSDPVAEWSNNHGTQFMVSGVEPCQTECRVPPIQYGDPPEVPPPSYESLGFLRKVRKSRSKLIPRSPYASIIPHTDLL